MSDFNRSLDEWHHCDIYQLYREPTVQDFLRKPHGNLPKTDAASQTLQEIGQLDPKHAFLGLTSMDSNNPKFIAGFRFGGSQREAERIISRSRSAFLEQRPAAQRRTLQYQRHEMQLL